MKKIISIIIVLGIWTSHVYSQVNWIEPANPDVTKPIKIYVDLSKTTNTSCKDNPGPFYIWTWKPKEHPTGHPLVNGTGEKAWKNSNDALKMTKDAAKGEFVWYYEMTPTEFYETNAADVYKNGISLLVKPKDGGGYGDPDIKTEDLNFVIEAPKTDRGSFYPVPAFIFPTEVVNFVYDNKLEKKQTMKGLGADSVYILLKANTIDTVTSITKSFQVKTIFTVSDNDQLKMTYDGNGIFRYSIIPTKFFNMPSNLKIVDVEVFIVKLGWQGIDDQSDLIKVKFNVCN
jgi:hypothetical protein